MGLSIYNIKKWYLMLSGKSISHVNQNLGKCFVKGEIKGYFNNMTEKVTMQSELLKTDTLPTVSSETKKDFYFPVAVFQYGLGSYDLYLIHNQDIYLKKFSQCAEWAINNQEENGAWDNFSFIYPKNPYGAMCQGEGASLLIRAYKQFNDEKYLNAAVKAVDFMLKPVDEGGTALYENGDIVLLEYNHRPAVLNGWIFALFGLYDLTLVCDEPKYKEMLDKAIKALIKALPKFDNKYWSLYDLDKRITSSFYHNLHIAQMQALYQITDEPIFNEYAVRFESHTKSFWKPKKAFIVKAIQKVLE